MSSIHCHFASSRWQECELLHGRGHVCGSVWLDAQRLSPARALQQLELSDDLDGWRRRMGALNGFHALVRHTRSGVVAVVDRVRSIPLFYGAHAGEVFVSDDADWVRQRVAEERIDDEARAEFELAGYVTGGDTLFRRVKQLRAGEALFIDASDGSLTLERYFRFGHQATAANDDDRRQASLEEALDAACERLVETANGRQIVVPLSGGYDSRLIATLLARCRYPRVLTYAYGYRDNQEARVSREVARALGLPWTFVEYSHQAWGRVAESQAYWRYQRWASGWTGIANMQDWLAVKLLTEQGKVEPGSLFAPGHCCVTGFVPPSVFETRRAGALMPAGELADALHRRHFTLNSSDAGEARFRERVLPRLARDYTLDEALAPEEFIRQFVQFGWQERQAKFIVNSVRCFEFFGHDWWMPLYDRDVMAAWQSVPLDWLQGRAGYVALVESLFAEVSGQRTPLGNAAQQSRHSLRARLSRLAAFRRGPGAHLKRLAKRLLPGLSRGNTLASTGRFPPETLERLRAQGYSHNGVAAQLFLERFC
ncbi:asparagine synthetase B family protein [Billgrantia lactosivorans]|uniref:asparagine synthase-related protein n=1 Tax=Billgrantia lactosivorans TaxID=2185141 RepID=UPI000DAE85C1|nr:asparagine synthetase B family protein [Halomonas lactosivorans]